MSPRHRIHQILETWRGLLTDIRGSLAYRLSMMTAHIHNCANVYKFTYKTDFVLHFSTSFYISQYVYFKHPSSSYNRRFISRHSLGLVPISSDHQGRCQKARHTTTHTYEINWERAFNLTVVFLDSGGNPEYLEKTHTQTGRTWKLGFKPRCSCRKDTTLNTALLCHPNV